MTSLSIVVPILNCATSIPAHLGAMAAWLDLAEEIVVIDSHSEDGSLELVRETLCHPNLKLLNHPRGLYQSWNHAISQTRGKWIYISTIGDTITREQLAHLIAAGEELEADVVVSQPEFVIEENITMKLPIWPIQRIVDCHDIQQPTVIDPLAALVHAVRSIPDAILGSSASNLYYGDHLRARPFPTCFRMAGDTGWAIRYALETRFCYTVRVGSIFRFHSDTYSCPDDDVQKWVVSALQDEGIKVLRENKKSVNTELVEILEASLVCKQSYLLARAEWSQTRREGRVPWYLNPSAFMKRKRSKILRRKNLEYMERFKELDNVLKKLPLQKVR
jgi:hypothetical protein